MVFGRESKPASHYFYRCDPPSRTKRYLDPVSTACLVELRCRKSDGTTGLQTVVPPSVHPEGEEIRFEPGYDGQPANVEPSILEAAVAKIAAAALLVRYWPSEKSGRNTAFIALAGALARGGWSLDQAVAFHKALYIALWGPGADLGAAKAEVAATFEKHSGGFPTTGQSSLADLVDQRAVSKALEWLGIQAGSAQETGRRANAEAADDWPKLEPIQSELPPVLPFREDLLPDSLRPLAADVAERMQVPMDYPAVTLVNCLAGVVSRRAVIQPKANDTGWIVVPNLWGGIVAPPGFLKSPVIQAGTHPLNQIQTEWRNEDEEALKEYEKAKEEYELQRAAWRDQFKAATKRGNVAPSRPEDEPEEPKLRRLIMNDATFEAMHQTMSENPAGILVIRDELTGWWSQLDRTGREGERAFCLQAWNGDTEHTIDRIGRGTIHVPHCCMSMLGGIQPGRLRSYLVDALHDGPSNDGLIQRFQLLVWPDAPPDWNYVDRAPNAAAEEQVTQVFRRLVQMDPEHTLRCRFDPDAQELFIDWLAELESKVRGNELHPALTSHLSKYRSLMPSLALLFHLAEGTGTNIISFDSMWRAAEWCEYLESHARRIYSCVVSPQLHAARELADKIKRRKVGTDGFFSIRDVYLKGWAGLDSPEAAKQAADVLQDAGWIRDVSTESGRLGGRPSNRYQVNPEVWR